MAYMLIKSKVIDFLFITYFKNRGIFGKNEDDATFLKHHLHKRRKKILSFCIKDKSLYMKHPVI